MQSRPGGAEPVTVHLIHSMQKCGLARVVQPEQQQLLADMQVEQAQIGEERMEEDELTAHEVLQAEARFDVKVGLTEGADAWADAPLVNDGAQRTLPSIEDALPPTHVWMQ